MRFIFQILRRNLSKMSNTDQNFKGELTETFLNLETVDTNLFRSHHLLPGTKTSTIVYGGQVIGQALVAAGKTVDEEYHAHSLHSYFIRPGNVQKPVLYQVDLLKNGASFCTRYVRAIQDGSTLCSVNISYHREEPNSIEHQSEMSAVLKPSELDDAKTLCEKWLQKPDLKEEHRRIIQHRLNNLPTTFDIKPVDAEKWMRIGKSSVPKMAIWVRSRGKIGDDPRLQHCVAAYISDSSMVGTALTPHLSSGFRVGMATSLDHSIWFHRFKFAIDEWMLYETESPIAGSGRAMIFGRLWSQDGKLVLSTAQEALVRAKGISIAQREFVKSKL